MKGYKAFNKGLICRGKQYAENTVFEEDEAAVCRKGMHFCKDPLEVLNHYPLVNDKGEISEFAEVEALDEALTDDNKKYCTKKLKIGAKISFAKLVQISTDFESIKSSETQVKTTSEDYAQIGSSGYSAKIGSSGYSAKIGSSGDYAKIGSSGDSAQIGSSGNFAQIGSSGDYAKIGSSGYSAKIGSSGDYARINSTGENSVVMCAGHGSVAKAKEGSWITLSEWKNIDGKLTPICVKTEKVDGETIKANTWYKLVDGEFVEVSDDKI